MADSGIAEEPPWKKARVSPEIFNVFQDKHEISSLLKSSLDDLCHSKHYCIGAIKIKNCNAAYESKGYCFSRATCDTEMYEQLYNFTSIFVYGEKILRSYLQDDVVPEEEETKTVLAKLLAFILDENCQIALKKMKKDRLCKTKLAKRLGHHLLSRLSCSAQYKLDHSRHDQADCCDCGCKEKFTGKFTDTSIGHPDCWHGNLDILVEGSVPVDVESESDYGSPRRNSVEVKDPKNLEDTDIVGQTLAQTIVFSFLQKQRHSEQVHYLNPGVCISPSSAVFYFYDCEHDILLRSPAFDLFGYQKEVNMITILAIWFIVNYRYLSSGVTNDMKDHKSNFFLLAKNKFDLYQHHLAAEGVVGINHRDHFNPGSHQWKFD